MGFRQAVKFHFVTPNAIFSSLFADFQKIGEIFLHVCLHSVLFAAHQDPATGLFKSASFGVTKEAKLSKNVCEASFYFADRPVGKIIGNPGNASLVTVRLTVLKVACL